MRVRKDGEKTRHNLLSAACEVFAETGYRAATNIEICRRAGANIAAINYHSGSKARLSHAVWEYGLQEAALLSPLDGGLGPDAAPEERLQATVRALVCRKQDRRRLGFWHRLIFMEMTNPSGLLDEAMDAWHAAARRHTLDVLRGLLGAEACREQLELCEMSLVSQCLFASGGPFKKRPAAPWQVNEGNLDAVVEHIVRFSLAGIAARRDAARKGQA